MKKIENKLPITPTEKAVKEFQKIYLEEFKEEISYEAAFIKSSLLLNLFNTLQN